MGETIEGILPGTSIVVVTSGSGARVASIDDLVKASRISHPVHKIVEVLKARGVLEHVVVFGDDPQIAVIVGRERVTYVYGSPWKLVCRHCGYRVTVPVGRPPKSIVLCPRCGRAMVPESSLETPTRRSLETAIYAVLGAEVVAALYLEKPVPVLAATLLATAARYGVKLVCDETIPDWITCTTRVKGSMLVENLGSSAHGRQPHQ